MKLLVTLPATLAILACSDSGGAPDNAQDDATRPAATDIAASLAPFGDGYPNAGDPCRRLGESEATSEWLDDSAALVGCPTEADADRLGGERLSEVDGTFVVSVPMTTAERAAEQARFAGGETVEEIPDPADPETGYNATAQVACGFDGKAPTSNCQAGIKRRWGEDGTHLLEVTKPDGRKRAIFFDGTTPTGADSAQSDGSAGWDFNVTRSRVDENTIVYGPETYVVPDALVVGG